MVLHHKILFSVAIVAIAEAILMRISAEQVPSLHRVSSRYLKLVTSFDFWPFMQIPALTLFVLLVTILLFSVLISILYALALIVCKILKFATAVADNRQRATL